MHLYDILGAERLSAAVPFLAGAVAKAMAIFVLGTICAMAARAASAATRHMIWTLTLAGGIAAPIVSAFVPRWGIPVGEWASVLLERSVALEEPIVGEPAPAGESFDAIVALPTVPSADVVVAAPAHGSSGSVAIATSVTAAGTATTLESRSVTITPDIVASPVAMAAATAAPDLVRPPGARVSLGTWLVVIWVLGAVVALVPALTGLARLTLVARRARPIHGGRWALLIPSVMRELDVRRRVRFVELDGPVMPMTWGIVRPVVLLPADDFNSTIDQRLDVLRHELAHVRRYDCLTQLVGQVACALNWFNPLAWIAARELRVERERACDDEVLRAGAKASAYADYLLRVARSTRIAGAAALGGLAMARPSQMAGRLLAVLDDRRRRERVSGLASTYAALVACLTVGAVASASPVVAQTGEPVVAADIFAVPPEPVAPSEPATPAAPSIASGPAAAFIGETSITPSVAVLAAPDLVAAPAPAPPSATMVATVAPNATAAPCDRTARRGNSSHSNWTSSDNGSKRWVARWSDGDCTYEIEARGDVKFNRDVTDIESISNGGSFTIEQHVGDDTKRLVVRPRDDGTLDRVYSENGARREFDSTARAWLAEALVALDRQTAFAVDQRVPAILERGGVDAVLREIELMSGDYARRRYYTKLLSMRQLDRAQIKRVVDQAGAEMTSDYELAELLVALSKLDAFGDDSHASFVTAAKKIGSDYERRRALNALLNRDRLAAPTVEALLDAASTIDSDYELAELLIDLSKRYAINDQTRPTYIQALGSIQSDYEHRRVLSAIVAGGGLTPAVGRTLLEDARRIASDYELAEFLILMAKKGALDATTRDAYFAAANKIGSDYEHHRALTPLLSKDLLTKEMAKSILVSAAKIDSDYECSQLLIELANAIPIDDELRPAFEKAADTLQSEYEYGRAMSAVRRRVTR
jgi:beta-lactamase regulating signal transducer with metallopeptidase domain